MSAVGGTRPAPRKCRNAATFGGRPCAAMKGAFRMRLRYPQRFGAIRNGQWDVWQREVWRRRGAMFRGNPQRCGSGRSIRNAKSIVPQGFRENVAAWRQIRERVDESQKASFGLAHPAPDDQVPNRKSPCGADAAHRQTRAAGHHHPHPASASASQRARFRADGCDARAQASTERADRCVLALQTLQLRRLGDAGEGLGTAVAIATTTFTTTTTAHVPARAGRWVGRE